MIWSADSQHEYLSLYQCISDRLLDVVDQATNSSLVLRNTKVRFLIISCPSLTSPCNLEEILSHGVKKLALEYLKIGGLLSHKHPNTLASSLPGVPLDLPNVPNLQAVTLQIEKDDKKLEGREPPDIDLLWSQLKRSGARLKALTLHYGISEALMDYLISYTGLEECNLDTSILPLQLAPHSISFSETVLPRHVSSLTSLRIACKNMRQYPVWEGMALNTKTWPQPSAFLKLTRLTACTPNSWELNIDNCQFLIDYASRVPNLKELNIRWTNIGITVRNFNLHMEGIGDSVLVWKCALRHFQITVGSIDDGLTGTAVWTMESWHAPIHRELDEEGHLHLSNFRYEYSGWDFSDSDSDSSDSESGLSVGSDRELGVESDSDSGLL